MTCTDGHCWHWEKKPMPSEELLDLLADDEDYCCLCPARRKHQDVKHGKYLRRASDWSDDGRWDYDVT